MVYTSYSDLANCLRSNVWKVPHDIDLIVGVPRSGMLVGLMLAELMNKLCVDLDSFIVGRMMSCGGRKRLVSRGKPNKVLVIDDTVFSGLSMKKVREQLQPMSDSYEFIFACVYAEGRDAKSMVDVYLHDIYKQGETKWFYEWNILHHYQGNTERFMLDIDGLLCKEPPDDRNVEAYEQYLSDAIPMVIPTTKVGALVTYRLEKYADATKGWLKRYGIKYNNLFMFDAADRWQRRNISSPECYKARLYKENAWAILFVESDVRQASLIHQFTDKPVFCYENGVMYK